jgi:nitrogen fixation-related uncharacterized protein
VEPLGSRIGIVVVVVVVVAVVAVAAAAVELLWLAVSDEFDQPEELRG